MFILVQLNKCVVMCGSASQRGRSGDGCLSLSIENRVGHLFLQGWARVRQVALGSVVSE